MECQQFLSRLILACFAAQTVAAHREHKVHNIVLYPDKHSWCKTTPIKQVVAYPRCNSIEIDNNVCVGTCFSYSIPRTVPSAPGEVIKPYCDSCQPSGVTWKNLTLSCGGEDPDNLEMQKSVQIITNCSCSTCDLGDDASSSLSSSMISSGDGDTGHRYSEGRELMDWMLESHNSKGIGTGKLGIKAFNISTIGSNISEGDPVMNERLLILLKQLAGSNEDSNENGGEKDVTETENGNNIQIDKVAFKKLLKEVEGADHRVNQVTLSDFVKHVEEREHIKVNLDRLRHLLVHFQHEFQNEKASNERHHSEQHRHHQHSHRGLGHHSSREQPEGVRDPEQSQNHHKVPLLAPLLAQSHHGHGVEELESEKLDATLEVEPHHLKPALEGSELSYQDNLVQSNDNDEESNAHKEEEF